MDVLWNLEIVDERGRFVVVGEDDAAALKSGDQEFADDDGEDNDFVGRTSIGGWWQPEDEEAPPQLERRRHQRLSYTTTLELVPPDGNEYSCASMNLSLGGVLLTSDALATPPTIGQLVEVRLEGQGEGEVTMLNGEVARHAEGGAFAVRFIHLDSDSRRQLALILARSGAEDEDEDDEPETSYSLRRER